MKKRRVQGLVGPTPRLSSLRRLETVMGVARAGSRLTDTPQTPPPPISKQSLAAATGDRRGVGGLAIRPQLGGSEGRGTAGLTTPPVPAVGGYEGRGYMWPHPQMVFLPVCSPWSQPGR